MVSEKEKRLTAYHEAGHAIATFYSDTQDPVLRSPLSPGEWQADILCRCRNTTRAICPERKCGKKSLPCWADAVAESLVLDDISTGASNDLERATKLAKSMVTRYGFSEKLGPVVYGQDEGEPFLGRDFNHIRDYSENVAAEIDNEIREIIDTGYETAKDC